MDRKIFRVDPEKDLEFLKEEEKILAIILFGSYLRRSYFEDIDICLVVPELRKNKELKWDILLKCYEKLPELYDIHFFELLPLRIKIEVLKTGKIIFVRNFEEFCNYVRPLIKIWEDEEIRIKNYYDSSRKKRV